MNLDVTGLEISRWAVSRRLRKHSVKPRVAALKEFLTDEHKRHRLNFANTYGDYEDRWWDPVIFCDEKSFGYFNAKYC